MKLVRWGQPGAEKPGVLDNEGRVRSLVGVIDDWHGAALADGALARVAALDPQTLPAVAPGERLGPCVGAVGKFVCVGLNYTDHAAEAGMALPKEPILFLKATSAINGPADPIRMPRDAAKVDWEVELGIVIGKTASYVTRDNALAHVAGYCVVNDVSERAFQLERGGQWDKGKAADTFGPLGPWLVTADEVPDPQALPLWLDVDGVRRQAGNTRDMIFGVAELVSYISGFMSLQPGDVIATGTPAGVGMGFKPPVYLQAGQTVRAGIAGLGEQSSPVVAFHATAQA
ncbi:2-keto-4-pentenoate hydratase/2-oxohepta-3-ene-1,7-dioic acid hydratase [Burkholderia sp. Ch1-1]|uniref:Ureidoglycolate lyase n=1 Tax=Paraburkholderia dioscoreae TaxID=2604047 RepID=A0A5Q4ZI00_9BURK|nr:MULTISPECIES: fumarylacetoacetate hydrolase family protein [Paraburkholderia]EIF35633.1 2-keto-4-pentenoate hydratase/2-oxohepta-3-ene-1,7-dioic acid hydratase [Burkholderia sp. Ch1-1]MDR8400534.1 fumarylacetoacetate hydrolase family protein [Paraburkholderia sp. USG1]VVD31541.1 Ureidoglycolate lyase [Paraburkholderia dioscoreae]